MTTSLTTTWRKVHFRVKAGVWTGVVLLIGAVATTVANISSDLTTNPLMAGAIGSFAAAIAGWSRSEANQAAKAAGIDSAEDSGVSTD